MLCALPDTAYLPDKETREKNEEPKVPLKISEKVIERMISGAALWKECNSI